LNQIQEVAKRIAERYVVEKILLFGSYAYGTPEEGSDVDLLVIMNHDKPSNRKQRLEICEALYPKPFPIDILVRTPNDVETKIPQGDWLLKDAYTKGKVLYDRA
jgi:predicted nucleotidyltransferase